MSPNDKIRSLKNLAPVLEAARAESKRVILCHGVFDLLHPGHIIHLREARGMGDLLVVTVTADRHVRKGPGRPAFGEQLRVASLAALACVDYVALNEWPTAVETIQLLKPDFYVKGSDYADASHDVTGKIHDEQVAIQSVGGALRTTEGEVFSSSSLINQHFSSYPAETQRYLEALRLRRSADEVLTVLENLSGLRVLVVGESILDRYTYCHPLARPPKEFIVSAQVESEETFAGGALATANHVAGFCKDVTLVTCLGDDPKERRFIEEHLKPNLALRAVTTPDRPTVMKQRYLVAHFLSKLFEVQRLDDRPLDAGEEEGVHAALRGALDGADLVIVSDFGHGMLTPSIRKQLCETDHFLAVNAQTNSANMGFNFVTQYGRADYVCIDLPELKLTMRDRTTDSRELSQRLRTEANIRQLMVSRGHGGSVFVSEEGAISEAPALATRVVDRVGAGDAFFAVTAPCVKQGCPPDVLGLIGNAAGALAVETVGNRTSVDPVTLKKFIAHLMR